MARNYSQQPSMPLQKYTIRAVALSSLAEARSSYSHSLLSPTSTPTQFKLDSIKYYKSKPGWPDVEEIDIRYATSDGHYLMIRQGVPVAYDDATDPLMKMAPAGSSGAVTVQGHRAFWAKGRVVSNGGSTIKGPQYRADPVVSLRWPSQPAQLPNVFVGYWMESDLLTVDDLVAIGSSVQPY